MIPRWPERKKNALFFHSAVIILKEIDSLFLRRIQGIGVSLKQSTWHFMIPEFVPYFGETLTEKDLLGRKG